MGCGSSTAAPSPNSIPRVKIEEVRSTLDKTLLGANGDSRPAASPNQEKKKKRGKLKASDEHQPRSGQLTPKTPLSWQCSPVQSRPASPPRFSLSDLPERVLCIILGFLDPVTILRLGTVCTWWLRLAGTNEYHWKWGYLDHHGAGHAAVVDIPTSSQIKCLARRLPYIKSLTMQRRPLDKQPMTSVDLSAVFSLKHLVIVDFESTNVSYETIAKIHTLKKLEALSLKGCFFDNGGNPDHVSLPTSEIPTLNFLNISDTNISDLSFLEGLPGLSKLDLSGSRVKDITHIKYCRQIVRLNAGRTALKSISPLLTGKYSITQLSLAETMVSDITPIGNLQDLKVVDLEWSRVSNLTPLTKCPLLEVVNVNWCPVKDLSPLANQPSIRNVLFRGTGVEGESWTLLCQQLRSG